VAKAKSLYGFSPDLEPFVGRTPAEQVGILRSWGNTVIFGGYHDPAFVDAAHDAGMAVYAEFGCFVGAQLWERFPASRPLTAHGSPLEPDVPYWGVNPAIETVRQDRLQALERLLTEHPIDGVWLDFIRSRADTGIPLPAGDASAIAPTVLGEFAADWTAWRCEQVTSWVARARDLVERVRPGALLGLFGVPWRLADYDSAILNVIGQDYRALGPYIDIFSPMVYHTMCGFEPEWIGLVTQEVRSLSGKPVWPIIQSVDEPTPLSAEEYGAALDIALNSRGSDGALVFTLEGALEPRKLAVTKARFLGE